MITILHGDNQVASRDELRSFKNAARAKGDEIVDLPNNAALTDIIQATESLSMFGGGRLVVIENFLSSLRQGKARDTVIDYLCKGAFDTHLVLWEGKGVGRSIIKLKKQKHVSVKEHQLPSTIFNFVDSLMPGNTTASLQSYENALKTTVPEVIFSMIVRQFRILIAISEQASIPETSRLAPWQKGKLAKQVQAFTPKQLMKLYKELLVVEYQAKTGRASVDLTTHIGQFIMNV